MEMDSRRLLRPLCRFIGLAGCRPVWGVLVVLLSLAAPRAWAGCTDGGALTAKLGATDLSCYGIYVPTAKNEQCPGIQKTVTKKDKEGKEWTQLQVRAVKYVPRPVGVPSGTDVYSSKYARLHKRDLAIIANNLKANTIRLDPWELGEDHEEFLNLCKNFGLYVIPTFDFKLYTNPKYIATDNAIVQQVGQDFEEFLTAANRATSGSQILAWSINHAMPLNTTVALGPKSTDIVSDELQHYFKLLCVVRHVHKKHDYNQTRGAYNRPLSLPVDLNSRRKIDDVGWYVGFAETSWGKWPDCTFWQNSPTDLDDIDNLRKLGMFDAWIAEGLGLLSSMGSDEVLLSMEQFNATVNKTATGIEWKDPTTRSSKDMDGTVFPACEGKGGCTYPTRKAVIAQFGFAAVMTQVKSHVPDEHSVKPDYQQELLQRFWTRLTASKTTCATGALVDEFMDDWDRNAQMGCMSQPYIHGVGEACSNLAKGAQAFPEWLGLNDQYTFMTMQCIRPRTTNESMHFCFSDHGDMCKLDDKLTVLSNLCTTLATSFMPWSIWFWICLLGAVMCLVVPVLRCLSMRCCEKEDLQLDEDQQQSGTNPGQESPNGGTDDGEASPAAMGRMDSLHPNANRRGAAAQADEVAGIATDITGLENLEIEKLTIKIPMECRTTGQGPRPVEFDVAIKFNPRRKGRHGGRALSKGKIRFFAKAHSAVQERRLMQQISAEEAAVRTPQVLRFLFPSTGNTASCQDANSQIKADYGADEIRAASFRKAMENIHARVMEGYLVWLESKPNLYKPGNKERLQFMLGSDGADKAGPRPLELMWIDMLLLRLVESLAEQMLHAPELIHFLYHKVRWQASDGGELRKEALDDFEIFSGSSMNPTGAARSTINIRNDSEGKVDDNLVFTLDYETLHEGIERLIKEANPFNGGCNFDDFNDCGLEDKLRLDLKKTFRESPSMLVLVDNISNFQPVFTMKMWVFLMAWGLHHGYFMSQAIGETKDAQTILKTLVLADSGVLLLVEVLSSWVGLCIQCRLRWSFNRKLWVMRRLVYFITGAGGLFLALFVPVTGAMLYMAYWAIRILMFFLLNMPWKAFLPGTPSARLPKSHWKRDKGRVIAIWLFMLSCCLAFETALVVPLSSGFKHKDLCQDACSLESNPPLWVMFSSCCVSCTTALGSIWFIVGLTAFFDIYYIFYFGTAIFGYCMGHIRGLNGILSTAQRHVDLSSGRRRLLDGIGGDALTDGKVMQKVFGPAWRMVWSKMTEAMFRDCIISDEEADRIVKAAGTVRWDTQEQHRQAMVLADDLFSELIFTVKAHRSVQEADAPGASFKSTNSTAPQIRPNCIGGMQYRQTPGDGRRPLPPFEVEPTCLRVKFPNPVTIYEFAFMTTDEPDSQGLDPTQWKLEGVTDQAIKKLLIDQSEVYEPPSQRGKLTPPFYVELWRGKGSAGTLRLDENLPTAAAEQIGFFCNSLQKISKTIGDGDTLLNCHVGALPSLTQIIPCYDETVINEEKSLQDSDGVNTNLAFIISQYPSEWDNLSKKTRRYGSSELYKCFVSNQLPADLVMEVRTWAAMRSQTVARTIVGAIQYHEVLKMLPCVSNQQTHKQVCELILAHQTFGTTRKENDAAVICLLQRFKDHPFYVVFDYDSKESDADVQELLQKHVLANAEKYGHIDLKKDAPRHASVMVRYNQAFTGKITTKPVPYKDAVEVVEILPRYYPLLVGSEGFRTQGKAGNQLGALRFAAGHYVQMMDANMGAAFSEACKVPFVLKRFLLPQEVVKDGTTTRLQAPERKRITCRILGFREFIFTEHHGLMGSIMASAEWSFGTICQRFLDGLGVRMHYGHPDFIDGFWASNRGSLSKASAAINLSEDIFAGFNVRMRGERSHHSDALAWEKGRESSFNAASLFFVKVSKGNVGVMRSRDLKILSETLDPFDNLSFYFASIGFYLNNWLIDHSMTVYLLVFVLLTMASQSLDSVGRLGSMLAAEWVVSMGIIAMMPRLMELTLEYGWLEGFFVRFLPSIPGIMAAFTFINKSIAMGVGETMQTGEAKYIATGRPNANTHYSWRECYFVHVESHFYPALAIYLWYLVYLSLTAEMAMSALPMFVILLTATAWIIAPIIFCPQPTFQSWAKDMSEYWKFMVATPQHAVRRMPNHTPLESMLHTGLKDAQSTLYEFWLAKALDHKRRSKRFQFVKMLWDLLGLIILLAIVQVSTFDVLWRFFTAFFGHTFLMLLWRVTNRPQALVLLAAIGMFVTPWAWSSNRGLADYLLAGMIMVQGLAVIRNVVLVLARVYLKPNPHWNTLSNASDAEKAAKVVAAKKTRTYDVIVEYLYVDFLEYELHLFRAMIIMVFDLVTQFIFVLCDSSFGLHSLVLLNWNLGIPLGVLCHRIPYQPGGRPTPGPSVFGPASSSRSTRGAAAASNHPPLDSLASVPPTSSSSFPPSGTLPAASSRSFPGMEQVPLGPAAGLSLEMRTSGLQGGHGRPLLQRTAGTVP